MLYLGVYFLIKLFSKRNASYSFAVVIYSIDFACETRSLVLMSLFELKYEVSLFLRFFAFPTYSGVSEQKSTPKLELFE